MNIIIPLGGGIAYKNHYSEGKEYLGSVESGKVQDIREFLEINRVNKFVKGDKEIKSLNSVLTLKYYNWSMKNFKAGIPIIESSGSDGYGNYVKYSISNDYLKENILDDITFIGTKYGGNEIQVILENALNIGNNSFKFDERIYNEVTYVGFYDFDRESPVIKIIE